MMASIVDNHRSTTDVLYTWTEGMPRMSAGAGGRARSRPVMAAIWKVVFHLPMVPTLTLARRPFSAIHSRSAEMPISRDIVSADATSTYPQCPKCEEKDPGTTRTAVSRARHSLAYASVVSR